MRVVIQRVSHATVTISGKVKGKIKQGLVVLAGIENGDGEADGEWLSRKIVNMRIFNDAQGVMNLSVKDVDGELLLVSQFTLHASTKKGNRPSYIRAAGAETAIPVYENLIQQLSMALDKPVQTGTFGADMQVAMENDGPVTILMDSKNRE